MIYSLMLRGMKIALTPQPPLLSGRGGEKIQKILVSLFLWERG
jgi:hypothetical protein